MKIEPGKVYETRDGRLVKVLVETDNERTAERFIGKDDLGRLTWRSAKGRFARHPHPNDLMTLVEGKRARDFEAEVGL